MGGQLLSPVRSGRQWCHPLAGEGFGESHGVAVGEQQRNAKLIVEFTLRVDAGPAGIYSRSDVRPRAPRRPPINPDVSINDGRNV